MDSGAIKVAPLISAEVSEEDPVGLTVSMQRARLMKVILRP